ncbi:hypothetical protein BJ912DRAFT_976149 [Pholiota molesta]|nr:hypothetical protein BJ912DRAFT_976149 [Pholiota molesta]
MAPLSTSPVSLEDIWSHQSYAGFLALSSAVAFGIVVWDYFQLLPEERSLYDNLRGPEWHSPAPWAFILLRYSSIVSALCSILYSSVKIHSCQIALSIGQAASVVVVASSGILFCCRLEVMWDYRRIPLAIYSTTSIIMTLSWIAVATQNKITAGGLNLPFGTNCQFERLSEWTPISYALSTAFTCLIFGMALWKVITTGTMVASVGVLVVYSVEMPTDLLKRTSAPYFILILMSMGSRIFLNLRLHDNVITRLEESNRFTAKNWALGDEQSSSAPTQSQSHEPLFDPSTMTTSAPGADVRSLGTYITTTTLTVPDTPATQTSFPESSLATANFSDHQGGPRRGDSVRSFVTASTRQTGDSVSDVPELPKRVRVGSVKSVSSASTHHTGTGLIPPSPKRKPVPSMKRVERTDSFRYFATTSNLKTDALKSTWHGI